MDHINEIYVYENWKTDTPSLIGTLYVDGGRGKQVVSFEYNDEWLKDLKNTVSYPEDSAEIRRYLAGDVLPGSLRGWTLVTVDGLGLGFAKGDGQTLKNHYPKALRRSV